MPTTADTPTAEPLPASTPNVHLRTELGSVGLNKWGGFIHEEFLKQLQGPKGMRVFREMSENDDIIGACLFAIEKFAGQVDWRVEAAQKTETTDAPKDERAEFVEQCLFQDLDSPWSEKISEILGMLSYGFSMFEVTYKRRLGLDARVPSRFDDGRIGWDKWAPRKQDTVYRWLFDDHDNVTGFVQKTIDKPEVPIPINVCLHFRANTKNGNPEGTSILRRAYVDWYFKRRIKEIEGIGIERDLAGLPVLTAPEGVDLWNPNNGDATAALTNAKRIATSIRNDEQGGVVLPFGWVLEPFKSAGARKIDASAVITRYDQRIAMTMLADFILVGHEQVGSKALSQTKLTAFAMAITSFLDHIAEVINRYAIPRLFRMNGWPLDNLPTVKHGEVEDQDLVALGEYLSKISSAGAPLFPNPLLEAHLHAVAKLPAPPEGFEARAEAVKEQEEADREAMQNDAIALEEARATARAKAPPGRPVK